MTRRQRRSHRIAVASAALACSLGLLGGAVLAQPKFKLPGAETRAERCSAMLDTAGFDNRYQMIGGITKTTACLLRGFVSQDDYDREIKPRLQLSIELCYAPDEQAYLRRVVQRGIIQAMPYATQGGCDETFAKVVELDLPAAGE